MTIELYFKEAPVSYLTLDSDMRIIKFNESAKIFLETSDLLDKPLINFIDYRSQDELNILKQKMLYGKEYSIRIDFYINGRINYVSINGNIFKSEGKNFYRLTIIDETLVKKQMDSIKYLSFHDQLTDTHNRSFLIEELNRLNEEANFPIGIIMADLNGLKLVNDSFGHDVGDQLLKRTGSILKNRLRPGDTLSRVGGDEFIIVLPKTDELTVKKIMNLMRIDSEYIGVNDLSLSISYGYSIKKTPNISLQNILSEAENRMYKDKLLNKTSQRKGVIDSILAALHEKHPREELHSKRVSEYAVMVGEKLNYDREKITTLKTSSILHDIGKIAIDYSILDKPGSLTLKEYEEIKNHPDIGFRILSSSGTLCDIPDIVLSHHEYVDGSGYPKGLKGSEIREESKILCVCDAYDAMTSDRPYRKGMSREYAISELIAGKNIQFDPYLVDIFISCL